MTGYDVKRFALVLAIQAEIIGMVTENARMDADDEAPVYNGDDFQSKAEELRNLAYQPEETL